MYEQLTEFLPILGEVYGNWAEINVKQPSMPFVVYETAARQLIDAIRDYVQQHNEYADYGQILQKAGIEWNYDSMSEADASILDGKTIVALLIGAVQAEKFCDGTFLGLLKQGCIIRWLGKLERKSKTAEGITSWRLIIRKSIRKSICRRQNLPS